ncbi:MAG TPA: anion permease [Candidatus Cottocaccamicrobium excrementipullorum]|nr:anion permease [Candidatus Cottocaccamicrobium excrementipullorum]
MNFNLIITLLVMVFMIVSFVIQKWSYGLTAMTCVVVLTLAGVIDVQTAFSGFSNTTTILIATMIVIAGQLSRTSLISRIRSLMTKAQDKGGILLILLICAFTALLTQLMGMTAVMAIMLLFVQTLKDDDASGISQSKMIFLCATMICTWFGRFPVGMGAALPLTTNAYYEGLVGGDSSQLLGIFDFMKVGLLPSIIGTIYCLFAWRLVPKQELRTDAIDLGAAGKQGGRAAMSQTHEMIVYLGFLVTLVSFFFSNRLGSYVYLIPAVIVIVFIFSGVMTSREAIAGLTGDMIWMVAGVLVFSTALSQSGAGEYIGNLVLKLLGSNPSGLTVTIVFTAVAMVMTTFMSNNGTVAILTPIAASTAVAGGMDPRAVVSLVSMASCLAIAFPTGCSAATIAFAVGGFNPIKMLKFTLPYDIIMMISLIISANIFFPVYG